MKTFSLRCGFSLIEVLIVVMLISAGILPVYTLMRSGQQRIIRADTRTMATLFGTSAIELARTLGYDRAQKLNLDNEYQAIVEAAAENGFDMEFEPTMQPVEPLPPGAKPMFLLRVKITVTPTARTASADVPVMNFVTIITDPRYSFY